MKKDTSCKSVISNFNVTRKSKCSFETIALGKKKVQNNERIIEMKQYLVDAFAEKLFTCIQAGVVVCKNMPDDEIMTKIAMENNYSETAFVVKRQETGNYNLKWFVYTSWRD